jgi:hypothetical protein
MSLTLSWITVKTLMFVRGKYASQKSMLHTYSWILVKLDERGFILGCKRSGTAFAK